MLFMKIVYYIKVLDYILQKQSRRYFFCAKLRDFKKRSSYCERLSLQKLMQFERRWKDLRQKYTRINIYGIEFHSIGETIPRLFMFLRDNRKCDKHTYNVVLPSFYPTYKGGIVNKRIIDLFGKYIHFINEDDISFWQFVNAVHGRKINLNDFDRYRHRKAKSFYNDREKAIIPFSDDIKVYARNRMKEMGVKGQYICLHARESLTKRNNYINYPETSVSNVDIDSFKQAVAYMRELGYQAVRMGRDERKKCELEGVIDYANNYYDEVMDFYLIANCRFLIGSPSGLTAIPPFWGRPVLLTNLNLLVYGFESSYYTKYDLYMPKKFYSQRVGRLLNLYEAITITDECDRYDERYNEIGITVIDNTEEEILNATIEMNEKMNQTWEVTEEEKECMKKYWQIIDLWKDRHKTSRTRQSIGAKGYCLPPMPICYSYLKENMYLLDVKEIM